MSKYYAKKELTTEWFVQYTVTFLKESKGIQKITNLLHSNKTIPIKLLVELLTPYAIALKERKIEEFADLARAGYEVIQINILFRFSQINY